MVAVYAAPGMRPVAGAKVAVVPTYVTVPDTDVAPCASVKLDAEMVDGSIASLKVAESLLPMGTPVAPLAGTVEITVGRVVLAAAPVVKVHT
jgi:hypothetical protein